MKKLTEQQFKDRVERSFKGHQEANKIKNFLESKGYKYTISLYGVVTNKTTKHSEYRRVEVFLNGYPEQIDVAGIQHFFEELIPYNYYSLWAYDIEQKEIFMIKGLD